MISLLKISGSKSTFVDHVSETTRGTACERVSLVLLFSGREKPQSLVVRDVPEAAVLAGPGPGAKRRLLANKRVVIIRKRLHSFQILGVIFLTSCVSSPEPSEVTAEKRWSEAKGT